MFRRLCVFFLLSFSFLSHAQTTDKEFTVKYIDGFVKADGILDEAVWKEADVAGDFQQYFTTDTLRAEQQTEIRMLYNGTTLYIGIKAY
ncbi:MAG: hydrolase, partial [Flavobacteriaceae bacterium]|nr:hydrolase [Flavobacteriaceae bacterium]